MIRLFRRGHGASRNPEPPPEFISQIHDLIKGNTHEQNAAIVRAVHDAEAAINRKLEKIMHTLDDLLAAVATQKTKIDSLVQLVVSLKGQVLAAMGSTLTPSQQDRIDRVFQAIQDNADEVDAAITANTVQASAGAISGGPSASDIKTSLASGGAPSTAPAATDVGSQQQSTASTAAAPQPDTAAGSDKAPVT